MGDSLSKYIIYTPRGLPAGLFGETYVIATGFEVAHAEFRAEYYILTQRPIETMRMGVVEISSEFFPEELGIVDIDFAIEEAKRQAEIDLSILLEERVAQLGRMDLAYIPFEFEVSASPFVSCRMRDRFTPQLMDIKKATKCFSLERYMSLIQQISVIRHTG